jgi:hypothetical protein
MGYGVNGGYGSYGSNGAYLAPGSVSPQFASGIYPPGSASGTDQFVGSGVPKKKGVAGFFQGILNGAVNTVKSLFTLQGILSMAGAGALVWATGGAALIPLAALGAGIGGFQMLNGLAKGDSESVGEGFFVAATSLLGLKFTPKKVNLNGQAFTLTNSASPGQSLGIVGRLKALWGGNKFVSVSEDGTQVMNIWQVGANKLSSRFQSGFSAATAPATSSGFNPLKPETWRGRSDVERLNTVDMKSKQFIEKYQDTYNKANEPIPTGNSGDNLGGNLKKLDAQNKAKADLKLMESQAQWPKTKTKTEYLHLDNKYNVEIRDLKLQRNFKKWRNASEAELQSLEQQIQAKETLRSQLLDDFKAKTAAQTQKRQRGIQDINSEYQTDVNASVSSGASSSSSVSSESSSRYHSAQDGSPPSASSKSAGSSDDSLNYSSSSDDSASSQSSGNAASSATTASVASGSSSIVPRSVSVTDSDDISVLSQNSSASSSASGSQSTEVNPALALHGGDNQ